jgi:hypothetical protein
VKESGFGGCSVDFGSVACVGVEIGLMIAEPVWFQ